MSAPTSYTVTVWACRRENDYAPIEQWQARASWGCPEQQVTGEPRDSQLSAIASAVHQMIEASEKESQK